jgi:hypothetical protein
MTAFCKHHCYAHLALLAMGLALLALLGLAAARFRKRAA